MNKVRYFNKYGIIDERHGTIKAKGKDFIFTPSDSTRKIFITEAQYISCSRVRSSKKEMIYIKGEYIPKPDEPT